MTFVILPKSVRQRSATNVKTQQNYIKWCILIAIILKERVAEKIHTDLLTSYIFVFESRTPHFI